MIDQSRKSQIQQIVSIFETGSAGGDPAAVALLPDGAGISYGIHQATDRSGALDKIVSLYLRRGGCVRDLELYQDKFKANASTRVDPMRPPPWVETVIDLLQQAAKDPRMVMAQRHVFDVEYWAPAVRQASDMSLKLPLSLAIVYDTVIHSGPAGVWRIRRRFVETPPASGGREMAWARAYVHARKQWLLLHPKPIVRRTIYRMEAFQDLMDAVRWDLEPPFLVRGQQVK